MFSSTIVYLSCWPKDQPTRRAKAETYILVSILCRRERRPTIRSKLKAQSSKLKAQSSKLEIFTYQIVDKQNALHTYFR